MSSSYGNKLARHLLSTRGTLKSCKALVITFNPWELETKSLRNFYHYINGTKIRLSNDKCRVVTDIKSEACEPNLAVTFIDDSKAIFKTKNMTTHDIAREFLKLSDLKAPEEVKVQNF